MTSTIKVNNVQNQCGQNIINENSNTITIGASGDTIALASGASQTGFGKTGSVDYITTPKTTDFTAVAGEGYFVNTGGGAVTVTLPGSPSAGDMVVVSDYNGSAGTNAITINRNSNKINGGTDNLEIAKANTAIQLVFVDATTGFQNVATADPADVQNLFVKATGGTETESGDFKIHTFTGPGTFTVSNAGTSAGSNSVSYVIVGGGGGGGGAEGGGGGGAGGFREGKSSSDCYVASPLAAPSGGLPVSVQAYPITVGAAGTAGPSGSSPRQGGSGGVSTFSTITSAGGGGGGGGTACAPNRPGLNGGSGGGGGEYRGSSPAGKGSGGSGNTPSVSPAQGKDGGDGNPGSSNPDGAGGGGGALTCGSDGPPNGGGPGGNGAESNITGSPVTRAGGGGGGVYGPAPLGSGGSGGGGTGGRGSPGSCATVGTVNTGGGGGGGGSGSEAGKLGGSGIVIIRYKFQ